MFVAIRSLTAILLIAVCASTAHAQWGHLTGRFIYDGPAPNAKFIPTNGKDGQACGNQVLDESLLVDKKTGGIANVVEYLRTKGVKVHPDYESGSMRHVPVEMKNCRFEPHIVLCRVNQDLRWTNGEKAAVLAPMFGPPGQKGESRIFPPGQSGDTSYEEPWNIPAPLGCAIHSWMRAYVLCRDNPYMAVTKPDGTFEIKSIPAGDHEFQFWHERTHFLNAKPTWTKGRATFTIKAGLTTDLGDIKLDPKLFNETEK